MSTVPNEVLEKFLNSVPKTTCPVCADEFVSGVIVALLDKIKQGETKITVKHTYDKLLVKEHGVTIPYYRIKKHIRECLDRDVTHG